MADSEARMHPARGDPSLEQPCVWVSAGVLSWRLCDREFDCEACPLYQALRAGHGDPDAAGATAAAPGADDAVGRYMAALGAGCTLHLDRAYTMEGLWLERTPTAVEVGPDDYTLRLLQPVTDVVLPRPGVWLRHGAPGACANRGRHAVAFRNPVAGEVLEVNPRPVVAVPPHDGGDGARWWFRLRAHEDTGTAPGLLRDEALLRWYLGRVRAVRAQLDAAMGPPGAASAPALADGGIPVLDLEIVLGRERFDTLLGTLFPLLG